MTYLPEPLLLSQLRAKLAEKPPFCSGILALPTDQLDLYFGQENAQYAAPTTTSLPVLNIFHHQVRQLFQSSGKTRGDCVSRRRVSARRVRKGKRDRPRRDLPQGREDGHERVSSTLRRRTRRLDEDGSHRALLWRGRVP